MAKSLVTRFAKDMSTYLYGNPHSASPSSVRSTRRVDGVRARLLEFFRASPEHYDLVFTANTTAAIKIVADAFRDVPGGFWYGYQRDAHTSLVGVREYASQTQCFGSDLELELFLKGEDEAANAARNRRVGLFAWPAQSNMNGRRHPLDLAGRVQSSSTSAHRTYTMLDAAAYCTTGQLDLSNPDTAPDFVALSLHKIFGFPDLGALIVRKSAGDVFKYRKYFGGGTVEMVTVIGQEWVSRKETVLHEQLEDGTLPFHQIVALESAMNVHAELYGCMTNITQHTCALAANVYKRLRALRHANGLAVCEIYKDPKAQYGNPKTQGPNVAFNIRNSQGGWIGKSDVEGLAVARDIHLRTGGVCNPGGIANFCALEQWEMRRNFAEGMRCGDNFDILGGKPTGVVRVSLGAMSTQRDVDTFIEFVEAIFVETGPEADPNQHSTLTPDCGAESTVEGLNLFPIRGCGSWKIPYYVNWGIGDRGLIWDREWCIISKDTGLALEPALHPRMQLIQPAINAERGTLKLTGPKAAGLRTYLIDNSGGPVTANPLNEDLMGKRVMSVTVAAVEAVSDVEEEIELEISLWESPIAGGPGPVQSRVPLCDAYEFPAVADFCSAVLGVPCTLARFRDLRKIAKDQPDYAKNLPLAERAVSMADPVGGSLGNINVSGASDWQSRRYVQIGQEYFENPYASEPTEKHDFRNLVHLRNTYDRSGPAQNPTVAAGDRVRTFTADASLRDPGLQACIASTFVEGHMCPVWDCRKAFSTSEALHAHYHEHKHAKPKPVAPRPADLHILQMAVNLPPLSADKMARFSADAATAAPCATEAVTASTTAFSRRTSRRASWRAKLSTIISRNSVLPPQPRV